MNPESSTAVKSKKVSIGRLTFFAIIIIALLGLYGSWHYYREFKSATADPNAKAEKLTTEMVSLLGRLMELPQGETPTVATISDKTKLAGQSFFTNAENGDVLFAYTSAMKAILFRPSTNKIINVAPISINQSQSIAPATSASKTPASTSTKK